MDYNRVNIGNRIHQARIEKGLKQSEVSSVLGITQSQYSKIELGKNNIPLPSLFKLAELLDVPIMWILGINNNATFTDKELLEIERFKRYIISIRKK